MEAQIELARENLKQVVDQDALDPATQRTAWEALNYIDRQVETSKRQSIHQMRREELSHFRRFLSLCV